MGGTSNLLVADRVSWAQLHLSVERRDVVSCAYRYRQKYDHICIANLNVCRGLLYPVLQRVLLYVETQKTSKYATQESNRFLRW